jgi:energy-coupling factor transport system permease protein
MLRCLSPQHLNQAMLVAWRYRFRNSLMEKIDPRARWLFSLLFLFTITMFWDLRFLIIFFGIAAIWYSIARVTFREARRAWILVSVLLILMVVVNTILTGGGAAGVVKGPGNPIVEIHFAIPLVGWPINFTLTVERLWFGLCQIIRVLAISAIFIIIPYSMDPRLYGFAFRGLGLPDRFAFSMDLAFRYVPTLGRDFVVTLDAQKARGYEIERVEGGLITQVKRLAPLIIPVTMSAILGGEDMANAMDLRCFGLKPRTWVQTTVYRWWDYAIIAFGIVLLVGSLVLKFFFHLGGFWVPLWIIPS